MDRIQPRNRSFPRQSMNNFMPSQYIGFPGYLVSPAGISGARSRLRLFLFCLVAFLLCRISAKASSATELSVAESRMLNRASSEKDYTIKRIVVVAQNVFSADDIKKTRVLRLLNRIHTPTRRYVVLRESLLKVGDVYDPDLAYETERNLRNLPFIYEASVTIDTETVDTKVIDTKAVETKPTDTLTQQRTESEGVTLYIRTIDRWSLSSGLKLLRRSERNLLQFGVTESNLLGFGHRVGVTYTVFNPDPSYVRLEYKNPRVFGSFNEFGIDITSNPFDRSTRLTLQQRYLHQDDVISYRFSYFNFRRRDINVTSVGDTAATFFQDGDKFETGFSVRTGDYHRKLTVSGLYRYLNSGTQDVNTFNGYTFDGIGLITPGTITSPADTFTIPTDSVLHEVTLFVSASRFDFYRERRIKYQSRVEDITILNGIGIGVGQGRDDRLRGHLYTLWLASLNYGARIHNFIFGGATSRKGWRKGGQEIRSTVHSFLIAYYNRIPWVTFAGRSQFSYDKRRDDPNPLSVDCSSGVRGYPANFVSGNKLFIGNLESRLITGLGLLTARMGLALHFDFGTAWGADEKFALDKFVWSAGPGLRIDMGQIGTVRVDLSYVRSLDSWQISAATGQFFDLNPGK